MQFSKATVISGIKLALLNKERGRKKDIELSLSLCLDDLATRLQSDSMLSLTTKSVPISSRTVEVRGPSDNLRSIFALKWSTGDNQKVLTFVDKEKFLKNYDNPAETVEVPTFWTQLTSSEGYPVVKFDVPTSKADTLTIYYFADLTQDNLSAARSAAAVVTGSIAYFYGIADGSKGQNYYERFKEQVKSMRSSDSFRYDPFISIEMSEDDKSTLTVQENMRSRRP